MMIVNCGHYFDLKDLEKLFEKLALYTVDLGVNLFKKRRRLQVFLAWIITQSLTFHF